MPPNLEVGNAEEEEVKEIDRITIVLSPISNINSTSFETNDLNLDYDSFTSLDVELPEEIPIYPTENTFKDFLVKITNTEDLSTLTQLKLRVISTEVTLQYLSLYTPALRELILDGSVLWSLRDLGGSLKNLKILKVNRCGLLGIDGVFGFRGLEELYATDNKIATIHACAFLSNLKVLDIQRNKIPIENISYLSLCENIEKLFIDGNPGVHLNSLITQSFRFKLPKLKILDGILLTDVAYKVLGTRDCSKLFLWVPKAALTVTGSWPKIKRPTFITTTYFWIQLTFLIFVEIGIYNRIELDKLEEDMFSVVLFPTIVSVICKCYVFHYKSKELADIKDIVMFKFWPSDLIDNNLKAKFKTFYQVILAYNITVVVMGFIFGIFLIGTAQYQDGRSLPLNVKYSFDYTSSPLYEILCVINFVGYMSVIAPTCIGADFLYMNIVAATSIQIRILQKCFAAYNTKEMININNKLKYFNIGPDKEWYDIRKEYFVKCVKHHQLLLKLLEKVNAFYDIIILTQLASSSCITGILIYSITKTYSDQTFINWIALIGALLQLLTYCLLENNLNHQATLLPTYIFHSEWMTLENKEVKADVIFLIQQTQQLPRLSCYKMYDLNMDLYIKVLKFAFSVYTLLSNMSR